MQSNSSISKSLQGTGCARRYGCCYVVNTVVLTLLGLGSALIAEEPKTQTSVGFRAEVVPILIRHCVECHNASDLKGGLNLTSMQALRAGGESGAVIIPNDLDQSPIWTYVADDQMPPRKAKLNLAEKAVLRNWIADGANWEGGPIDPHANTTEQRAGKDWWSLQPLKEVIVPVVQHSELVSNDIDRFVLAKLEQQGLSFSALADERTLARRVSFAATGLPPTPIQLDKLNQQAVNSELGHSTLKPSTSATAYQRLVDELLDSPHYGERWARLWFDVIRYGESQGFERNWLWPNSWRYRDWVIL